MIAKVAIITLFFGIFGALIWSAMGGLSAGIDFGFTGLGYLDSTSVLLITTIICGVIVAFAIDIFF